MDFLKSSSIIDQPVTLSRQDELSEKDKFGISRYEYALTEFIKRADTPLTIALQGEWGSGKTSLMNLLKFHLCEAEEAPFYSVWINTWQHSIMSDPESSIINILKSIICQLGSASGETAEEKKKHIKPLLEKTVKIVGIGAANIVGRAALGVANVGSDLYATAQSCKEQHEVPENGDSKIAELRNDIAALISKILKGKERRGFLFFIDDLDRIDPPVAVQILELLKNIFDLEHCIYILAIDYDVVVKGLKPKFGELTDQNAREFRSFFDKIIQLPFAMPVSSYKIDTFLIDVLNRIGYLTPEELANEELKKNLSDMALYSVGTNPRSLKRLTNILSLIQLMAEGMNSAATGEPQSAEDVLIDKQVNFGLVCLQITYPLVYNTLLEFPNFRHWGDETGDANSEGKTLVRKLSLQELTEAEQKKLERQGEDFDEKWEQTLFRICLKDNYLASRVVDISRLLNTISKIIPTELGENNSAVEMAHDNAVSETIDRLIRFSAVTNVHVTEDTVAAKKIEDFNPSWWLKQFRDKFIPALNTRLGGLDTVKCLNGRVQSKLRIQYEKLFQSGLTGDEAWVSMGHDEKSYNLCWANGNAFLRGGFGSIEEEEQLLGCIGLHDSIVAEIRKCAAAYPEIKLDIQDVYNGERKNGSFVVFARLYSDKLEALVSDEMVSKLAEFVSAQLPIRLKMVQTELNALCWGHDDKLREQLEKVDIAPFAQWAQWWSQTYLEGCKLSCKQGEIPVGISLWLRSTGFQCLIWEGFRHDTKHQEWILAEVMKSYPALSEIFPEHKEGDWAWYHPGIIPFDGVIDWVKNLLELLKRLQLSNQ